MTSVSVYFLLQLVPAAIYFLQPVSCSQESLLKKGVGFAKTDNRGSVSLLIFPIAV